MCPSRRAGVTMYQSIKIVILFFPTAATFEATLLEKGGPHASRAVDRDRHAATAPPLPHARAGPAREAARAHRLFESFAAQSARDLDARAFRGADRHPRGRGDAPRRRQRSR